MAGDVVGYLLVVIGLKLKRSAFFKLLKDEAHGHLDGVPHLRIVHSKEVGVFITEGERAG